MVRTGWLEKPLHGVGSSKKDLLTFPEDVVRGFGYAMGVVQAGGTPPSAKPWKGEGPGTFELIQDRRGGTWRVVYTVRFGKAVYALHSFQKTIWRESMRRSKRGPAMFS